MAARDTIKALGAREAARIRQVILRPAQSPDFPIPNLRVPSEPDSIVLDGAPVWPTSKTTGKQLPVAFGFRLEGLFAVWQGVMPVELGPRVVVPRLVSALVYGRPLNIENVLYQGRSGTYQLSDVEFMFATGEDAWAAQTRGLAYLRAATALQLLMLRGGGFSAAILATYGFTPAEIAAAIKAQEAAIRGPA